MRFFVAAVDKIELMSGIELHAPNLAAERARWFASAPEELATDDPAVAAGLFTDFVAAGLADLPMPGSGSTAGRFDGLAEIARFDLTLARLVEAHTDAIAILTELNGPPVAADQLWGVWAAEPPKAKVVAELQPDDSWLLSGRKAWCSGAGVCSNALITATAIDGTRLFAIDLDSLGVTTVDGSWTGIALTGADTQALDLHQVVGVPVGDPGRYVARPGFWHGAAGVAAVWRGGAIGVARTLAAKAAQSDPDDLLAMALGAVEVALGSAAASLAAAALSFDADPLDQSGRAAIVARRTRGVVEVASTEVLALVGRALGAAPLAMNRQHARRVNDLTVYLRQSHADIDLADLGRRLLESELGVNW